MICDEMPIPSKKLTPLKSIKFYCKHICCANDIKSWKECPCVKCALFPYRMGKTIKKQQQVKKVAFLHNSFTSESISEGGLR